MSAVPKLAAVQANQSRLEPVDILTPAELAERLKVPLSWVYKQTAKNHSGSMPVLRVGNYLRFDWNAVSEWLRTKR